MKYSTERKRRPKMEKKGKKKEKKKKETQKEKFSTGFRFRTLPES
jgi:hypothetical protein